MYLVKLLTDLNYSGKKGDIIEMNDYMTLKRQKNKTVEIIKYLGRFPYSPYYLEASIRNIKLQIKSLQEKLKSYEIALKQMNEEEKQ